MTMDDAMFASISLVAGAFLIGAIPSGYIAARLARGIDIRRYGSGNVGASNVIRHVGARVGLLTGAFDCLIKGALAVAAVGWLGMDGWTQSAAAFAAVAGHCWSPFIGFTGGRGVATGIGAAVGLGMWSEILMLAVSIFAIGRLLTRDTALWVLAGMAALPLVALAPPDMQTAQIALSAAIIVALIMAKRLTANWERPQSAYPLRNVLVYRLIWDRDVPKSVEWTGRDPAERRTPK